MFSYKKAQVAETMTWFVATIIIVVVLSISVFAAKTISFGGNLADTLAGGKVSLKDKELDFLAMESVTSFISNKDNAQLLTDYNSLNPKDSDKKTIEDFLKVLRHLALDELPSSTPSGSRYSDLGLNSFWNFQNSQGIFSQLTIPQSKDYFDTRIFFQDKLIRFWEVCQGKCR